MVWSCLIRSQCQCSWNSLIHTKADPFPRPFKSSRFTSKLFASGEIYGETGEEQTVWWRFLCFIFCRVIDIMKWAREQLVTWSLATGEWISRQISSTACQVSFLLTKNYFSKPLFGAQVESWKSGCHRCGHGGSQCFPHGGFDQRQNWKVKVWGAGPGCGFYFLLSFEHLIEEPKVQGSTQICLLSAFRQKVQMKVLWLRQRNKKPHENAPPPRHPQVPQHDSHIATGSGEVRLVLHRPQQRRSHGWADRQELPHLRTARAWDRIWVHCEIL